VDEEWNGRDDRKFSRENTGYFRKAKKMVREGGRGKEYYESDRMRSLPRAYQTAFRRNRN
jgi:hypothetical protein